MSTTIATTQDTAPAENQHIAISNETRNEISRIQEISRECELSLSGDTDSIARSLVLARGMKLLRAALMPMMADILELRGSPLGFRTDLDSEKEPYSVAETRDALIEALLLGARPVGNEFCIIAARAYLTREFFERKVREIPGLTDLEINPGVPAMAASGGGALVPIVATWNYNGRAYKIERIKAKGADGNERDDRIPVRVNAKSGVDATIGKAIRKMLAQIHRRMTGSILTEDAEELSEAVIDVTSAEAPAAASVAQDVPDAKDAATGFDYTDLMTEYGAKLDDAAEAGSIVAAGQARAWALGPEMDLPDDVRREIARLHDECVAEIRAKRGGNSNPKGENR